MENSDLTSVDKTKKKSGSFFVRMAILFLVLAFLGFMPSYVAVSTGTVKLHWFAHIHGAIMTSWLVVFLIQARFISKNNVQLHRRLGFFLIGLGVLVWLVMCTAGIRARIVFPPPLDAIEWDILLIELEGIILFGLFFTWGIVVRKKSTIHKRLLFFATAILLQAAIDRMPFLPWLYAAVYVRFIYMDVFLIAPLFIYDFLNTKRIHKITMIGSAIIIVIQLSITMLWGSSSWHKFSYNCYKPFMEVPVEIKLSDAQIAPILGDYGDKNWHLTIYREDNKLYISVPGAPKYEMGAITETEFFLKTMTWKVSFIKATDGKILKIINKQPGLTWEVPKWK